MAGKNEVSKFLVLDKSRKSSFASIFFIFAIMFSSLNTIEPANAGVFDCVKAKKWSNYSKLRTAYFKDPALKSEEDWFRAYVFATIFTGYPKCFKAKDVNVMRKFADVMTQTCAKTPSWNFACPMIKGRGALANWAYESYK